MKTNIFVIILILLISSCSKKEVSEQTLNKDSINVLIDRAINHGDSKAYNQVHGYYNLDGNNGPFLYYSILMAHKYNLPDAYYDVYWTLANPISGETFNELDLKTKYLALFYLLKSYELGYENSKYNIQDIFGKNAIIPKSSTFIIKFSELNN